ncbi:hypothetical protein [Desulfoferula mesophila]|uniref:Cytochrome c domain-containing protein n=1 Tax=Desulfoferula mesophila TaxID=3058419 RepID=A0AAU9EL33_9BACT|nr:hypothetical protein FAK_09650 [Desulfoferula mesophilus]
MRTHRLSLSLALTLVLVLVATGFYWLFSSMGNFPAPRVMENNQAPGEAVRASQVVFDPPRPEDAPESIRDGVMLGYHILMDTQTYAKEYVGNTLNCRNCHFNAGRERNTLSLVGVAVTYPKYRERRKCMSSKRLGQELVFANGDIPGRPRV